MKPSLLLKVGKTPCQPIPSSLASVKTTRPVPNDAVFPGSAYADSKTSHPSLVETPHPEPSIQTPPLYAVTLTFSLMPQRPHWPCPGRHSTIPVLAMFVLVIMPEIQEVRLRAYPRLLPGCRVPDDVVALLMLVTQEARCHYLVLGQPQLVLLVPPPVPVIPWRRSA